MSAVEQAAPAKSGPSLIIQIVALLVLTLVALAMGWGGGRYLISPLPAQKADQSSKAKDGKKKEKNTSAEVGDRYVVSLDPILTNLSAPSKVWVRLELSLVFDGPVDQSIARAISQDILAYIRTVKLAEVEGPSGFQHLREDLEERASVRSGGRVKKILIRTLLFE
jgi:flagellar FliL protein